MIDKRPTPGDLTEYVMEPYYPDCEPIYPSLSYSPSERVSEVLGPDGEPLMVGYPRPAIGFDLRPRK